MVEDERKEEEEEEDEEDEAGREAPASYESKEVF